MNSMQLHTFYFWIYEFNICYLCIYVIIRGDEQGDNGRKLRGKWMELNGKSLQS